MTDLLNLAIVGAAASVLTQLLKLRISDGLPRAGFAIVISLVLGGIAYAVQFVPTLQEALIGTILISNIVYTTIVKQAIERE